MELMAMVSLVVTNLRAKALQQGGCPDTADGTHV